MLLYYASFGFFRNLARIQDRENLEKADLSLHHGSTVYKQVTLARLFTSSSLSLHISYNFLPHDYWSLMS